MTPKKMGKQASRLVGQEAKVGRLRRGIFNERVQRDQIEDQLSSHLQPRNVLGVPRINRPVRGILEDYLQFLPRLRSGAMRSEDQIHKQGATHPGQNGRAPGHADEENLLRCGDRSRGNQARGVADEHGAVGAEIREQIGGNSNAPNERRQRPGRTTQGFARRAQ